VTKVRVTVLYMYLDLEVNEPVYAVLASGYGLKCIVH